MLAATMLRLSTSVSVLSHLCVSDQNSLNDSDIAFYLILNVAVGGTNGYFPDNLGGKPWLDASPTAMKGELVS